MTPEKKKAIELVDSFIPIVDPDFGKIIKKTTLARAKRGALICIREMQSEIRNWGFDDRLPFLKAVEKEINAL